MHPPCSSDQNSSNHTKHYNRKSIKTILYPQISLVFIYRRVTFYSGMPPVVVSTTTGAAVVVSSHHRGGFHQRVVVPPQALSVVVDRCSGLTHHRRALQ